MSNTGGKSPHLRSRYKGKRPLGVAQESAIYTLLSQSAHSFSLGPSAFAGFGKGSPAGGLNSFLIATQVARIYLADTAKTYCKFRRHALGKLSEEEAHSLENSSDPTELIAILKSIRAGTPA